VVRSLFPVYPLQAMLKWAKLVFQTLGMAIGSFLPSVCQGFLGSLEEMLWEGHWL